MLGWHLDTRASAGLGLGGWLLMGQWRSIGPGGCTVLTLGPAVRGVEVVHALQGQRSGVVPSGSEAVCAISIWVQGQLGGCACGNDIHIRVCLLRAECNTNSRDEGGWCALQRGVQVDIEMEQGVGWVCILCVHAEQVGVHLRGPEAKYVKLIFGGGAPGN